MTDNIDNLMRDLALADSGLHRHENSVTGATMVLPDVKVHPSGSKEARAAEDAWEARSIQMHVAQTPVTLAEKPRTNELAERVVRGD